MFKAIIILFFIASCQSISVRKLEDVFKKPWNLFQDPTSSSSLTEGAGSSSDEPSPVDEIQTAFIANIKRLTELQNAIQHELAQLNLNPVHHIQAIQSILTQPEVLAALMAPILNDTSRPQNDESSPSGLINPNGVSPIMSLLLGNGGFANILSSINPLGSITSAFTSGSVNPLGDWANNMLPINNILKLIYGVNLAQIASLIGGQGVGLVGQKDVTTEKEMNNQVTSTLGSLL